MSQNNVTTARRGKPASKALRWTLQLASLEFHTDPVTLEKRRRALGIEAGPDQMYSSFQIKQMIFGDKDAEMIGKLAAEREQIELKNGVTKKLLIETAIVIRWAARIVVPIRQRILSSPLADEDKHEILADLVRLGEADFGDYVPEEEQEEKSEKALPENFF